MEREREYDYYVSLQYKVVLHPSPEGGFAVEIPDLPGCISQGESEAEAYANIEDAKRAWLEIALEIGREIPEPSKP